MKASFLKKALPHVIAILLFLVIAVVFFKTVLEGLVLQQEDVVGYKGMAQQSIEYRAKYGHYPLWTESTFSGMPTYNIAIEASFKYLVGYIGQAMQLGLPKPANFLFLACVTFYFLALVMGLNPWLATLAAIGYAWSTYDPIIIVVGHDTKMMAMAYAPAVIAGLILLLQGRYLWGAAILAAFTSMQVNTQHLQVVYYTMISAGVLTLCYLIASRKTGGFKTALIGTGLAAVAGGIGFATMAVLIMPVKDMNSETMRGGKTEMVKKDATGATPKAGLDRDYAFSWSYGIPETFTLAVPRAVGGGKDGKEVSEDAKFAEKLSESFGAPLDNALQRENYMLYWGAQDFTSGPVYLGAIVVFLFFLGCVFVKGWSKWWLIAISVIGIVLAWGKNFPAINYFLFDHLPFYNNFRAPTLSLILPQFAFPLLGALGLQELLKQAANREIAWKKFRTSLMITGGLLVLLVGYYFMASYSGKGDDQFKQQVVAGVSQQAQGKQPGADVMQQATSMASSLIQALRTDRQSAYGGDLIRSIVLIALAAVLIGLYLKDKYKEQRILLGALVVLSSYDLLGIASRYLNESKYVEQTDLESQLAPTAADQRIKQDPEKGFRVFNASGDPFQMSLESARTSYNHNNIGGYSPAKLGLYQDLLVNQLYRTNPNVLNMLNTKYVIQDDPQTRQPVAHLNPDANGAAWLVKGIDFVANGNDEMKALDSVSTRDTVIIQSKYKDLVKFQPVPDSTASIHLIDNKLDEISYKFSAKTNQFAVFSEIYYEKGWEAYIDGQKTDYLRVDYVLRGMAVPAGDHTIEFKFRPKSFIMGDRITTWSSLLVWIGLLAAVVFEWRKRSRKAKA